MKTLAIASILFLLCASALADPRPTVVLHPTATVTGDSFLLSDIATITCSDTTLRAELMNATMGRCPLSGLTREFNEGDVCLKLRQAGIDPTTLAISGANDLVITGSGTTFGASPTQTVQLPQIITPNNAPKASNTAQSGSNSAASPSPDAVVIHSGDHVTLVYDDDGMAISADVIAQSSGTVGSTITLRRDGAVHLLQGIVQDAQTVKLVE